MKENHINMLDIQRLSTEDGPGLRTTLFTKGCPLKCEWCHNPESISAKRQIIWIDTHCMGCKMCVKACQSGALKLDDQGLKRDEKACIACAKCADVCPTGAIEVKGHEKPVEELAYELLKDRVYFEESNGGVTISGGDPLMQSFGVKTLFEKIGEAGIQTALDSTLYATKEVIDRVMPYVDLLLLDIKLADDVAHQKWTGVSNKRILENAKYIAEKMHRGENPSRLWIRTPIIPGATATTENVREIAQFIKDNLSDVFERWELCAFNNLCKDKYRRLEHEWYFANTALMTSENMDALLAVAKATLGDSDKVSWTGAVQVEE